MKEKNTQNVAVPTKDTRQFKHTPKTSNRLISKIFALVVCFVLLASLALPCFADNSGYSYPIYSLFELDYMYFPNACNNTTAILQPPFTKFIVPGPFTGYDVTTGVIAPFLQYPEGSVSNTSRTPRFDTQIVHQTGTQNYICTTNTTANTKSALQVLLSDEYDTENDTSSAPVYFEAVTYVYNRLGTNDNKSTLPRIRINLDDTTAHTVDVLYVATYQAKRGNEVYTRERSRGQAITTNEAGVIKIALNDVLDYLLYGTGDDAISYIEHLEIQVTSDEPILTTAGGSTGEAVLGYDDVLASAETLALMGNGSQTVVQQVVNSGSASSFVDFLSNTVGSFLGTPLFEFGVVVVTPGAILSVFAGVAILLWLLKLFLGG